MRQGFRVMGFAVLALLSAPILAQDADPPEDTPAAEPDPPAEVPERAEPAPEASSGEITGDAKAGLVESMTGSSGSSHTESSSDSSSSSVTFGNADNSSSDSSSASPYRPAPPGPPAQMPGTPTGWTVDKVAATWTLQLSGVTCGLQLRNSKWMGDVYSAYPSNTCAAGVSNVAYWQPANAGGIRLLGRQNQLIAKLWPYGPKRFEGKIGGEKAVLTR